MSLIARTNDLTKLIGETFTDAASPNVPEVNWRSAEAVIERARRYIMKIPGGVSGSGGSKPTFSAACILVEAFGLDDDEAYALLAEWSESCCTPPWSEKELRHKIKGARSKCVNPGYLANVSPERYESVGVAEHVEDLPIVTPVAETSVEQTTMKEATLSFIDNLSSPQAELLKLRLGDVDAALGGGCELGEMVIIGARPSHGKSAAALQITSSLTQKGRICAFMSEEMRAESLGKRTMLTVSETPEPKWKQSQDQLKQEAAVHFHNRAECYVVENCHTVDRICDEVKRLKQEKDVQCVVIDYAQMLEAKVSGRYEKVTYISQKLKQLAKENNLLVFVLCQLGREVDKRESVMPKVSDLKESGQLEQDADVILFLVWPWMLDSNKPKDEYVIAVMKNRNREVVSRAVRCTFDPSRQRINAAAMPWQTAADAFQ